MDKQSIETILTIIIIFLGTLLFLSVVNGSVTIFMTMGALAITYIFIHYWEKRFLAQKQKSEIKRRENM